MRCGRPSQEKEADGSPEVRAIHERSPPPCKRLCGPTENGRRHTCERRRVGPLAALVASLTLVAQGCALTTGYTEQRTTESNERRCAPTQSDVQLRSISLDQVDRSNNDEVAQAAKARLPTSFSWRAIQTATAIDVLPLLSRIEVLEESPPEDAAAPLQLLALRQEVLGRVLLALIAVSSTAAQVSCEIERTYQVADRLKNAEQARVKQQTLWAVIVGAGAAIATGGFSLAATGSVAEDVASIVGGTVAGILGIAALYQESEQRFEHPDNILREVWGNPSQPRHIPPSVWAFLNRPIKDETGSRTFREELINNWRQEGRLGAEQSEEEARRIGLLFGPEGPYRSSDLVVRSQMLDMLRATIMLMNQELELLIRELMIQMALRKESWEGRGRPP